MKNLLEEYPYLTFEELKNQFPDYWVLLLNPKVPPIGIEYYGGDFVYSHKNKLKVAEKAAKLPDGSHFAIVFAGEIKIPHNTIICL